MGTLSNSATTELVDHVFKAAYTPVATLYLCLCTSAPTAASTGSSIVETDYAGYVRQAIDATYFNAATSRSITQALEVVFAKATGASTSNITHWAICDAATAGNMLAFGAFSTAWNPVANNTPKIAAGQIVISIGASVDGFTDISVHKMLNLMFRNVAWSTPSASIYFGLATATISDADTMTTITECAVANSYARKAVPTASIDAASAGVTTNNTAITFPSPSGSWGLVTSLFVVNDASGTAGDLLAYDNTNVVDQTPTTGDVVQIDVGNFDCNLS